MFLKILQNSKENTCARVFFKKRLWNRYFPVNFANFLRTHLLQNTSGRLLLAFSHKAALGRGKGVLMAKKIILISHCELSKGIVLSNMEKALDINAVWKRQVWFLRTSFFKRKDIFFQLHHKHRPNVNNYNRLYIQYNISDAIIQ